MPRTAHRTTSVQAELADPPIRRPADKPTCRDGQTAYGCRSKRTGFAIVLGVATIVKGFMSVADAPGVARHVTTTSPSRSLTDVTDGSSVGSLPPTMANSVTRLKSMGGAAWRVGRSLQNARHSTCVRMTSVPGVACPADGPWATTECRSPAAESVAASRRIGIACRTMSAALGGMPLPMCRDGAAGYLGTYCWRDLTSTPGRRTVT